VGTAPALHDYREGCPESQRPAQKWALPHPVYGTSGSLMTQSEGLTERFLYVYDQHQLAGSTQIPKFVALGSPDSLRRVLSCERMITGEYLFTIKARHALGVLPEVNSDAVPPSGREKVIALLDKLVDAAYRGSPDSIIDRAGDTAQWCLATWLVSRSNDDSLFKKDFSQLIAKVKAEPRLIIPQAAEILRMLHVRVKPNAEERYGSRPVTEDDAELALRAVGILIREFDWVRPD
jgi:hypothetical protein